MPGREHSDMQPAVTSPKRFAAPALACMSPGYTESSPAPATWDAGFHGL